MNPQLFVELAGRLVANPALGDPALRYRTAIGRAYYGAYNLAVDVLDELGMPVPRNATGHEAVCRELRQTNEAVGKEAATHIGDLRTSRNGADYHLDKAEFENEAKAKIALEASHRAIAALEKCLLEPLCSKLRVHFASRPKLPR